MNEVKVVKVYPTFYWVEKDLFGSAHVMVQHEGMHPFTYATFNYDYAYTSNAGVHNTVVALMERMGIAENDIVWKNRAIQGVLYGGRIRENRVFSVFMSVSDGV